MKTLILAAACFTAVTARAHHTSYSVLLSGAAEAPPNASPAVGSATVTLDLDLITLRVEASFSGLLGNVTAAHLHGPTALAGSGTAGVMTMTPSFLNFPLGVTSGVYDQTFDLALASSYNPAFITSSGGTVSDGLNALIAAVENGKAYLNIHTTAFSGGEIRGFLVPVVPEPGSFVLTLCGAAALLRRRRSQ
jgi:hypothetical protein